MFYTMFCTMFCALLAVQTKVKELNACCDNLLELVKSVREDWDEASATISCE